MLRCNTKNSGRILFLFFCCLFEIGLVPFQAFTENALDKIAETEVDTPQHEKQKSQ